MRDITGKVAFITGGASGMGLAMARSFAAAGMKVAIADVEQAALDRVKAEFKASNAEVITLYRPLKPGQVMLTTQFRFPEDLVAEVKNDRFRFKMAVRLASSASSNSI